MIQRNAIKSWIRLHPEYEIILCGDESGIADVAERLGLRRIPDIERNEHGTPFFNGILDRVRDLASHGLICFINADIILMRDFVSAVEHVFQWRSNALMMGRRTGLEIPDSMDPAAPAWEGNQKLETLPPGAICTNSSFSLALNISRSLLV